jgi:hypothetical protein
MNRYTTISIVLVGVLLGIALPSVGCQHCPDYEPEGSYIVLDFYETGEPSHDRDWVEGSGRVEVDETAIVISYATPDGSRWEVEYMRTTTRETGW